MLAKFTKVSRNDNDLVTLRVSQLKEAFPDVKFNKNAIFIVGVANIDTLMYCNRDGETLATRAFPSRLDFPDVSNPVLYSVDKIIEVAQYE